MNLSSIWWQQVGRSLRLFQAIVHHVQTSRSFVLRLPTLFPWEQEFYNRIQSTLSALDANKMFRFLDCSAQKSPGQQVVEELCSEEVRAGYWPNQDLASYLADLRDVPLNQMFIWVRGISSVTVLENWKRFAAKYSVGSFDHPRAVFILEYREQKPYSRSENEISYTITSADCQVFCLEAASLQNDLPVEYLATLAFCMGDEMPEQCGALLNAGNSFLQDPVSVAEQILTTENFSNGQPFFFAAKEQLRIRAWQAQIIVLFPLLEQRRIRYIQVQHPRLKSWLPITGENGQEITDPYDLEYGNLFFLTRRDDTTFSSEEVEIIRFYRDIRNLLAHNTLIPSEKALRFLSSSL